jgi:NADH dehydrogenase FAD-containing subunit
VAIIGGGTAGITVAAQLARRGIHDTAIIEPSTKHYYQPLWTLVGAGVAKAEQSVCDEARYIPKGVRWVQDYAVEIDPDHNCVWTRNGTRVQYDFLVVAPGVESDWDKIQGARDTLGKNVFALGDAAGLPVSRTGAAVRKQAPVLIHNLLNVMQGKEPDKRYNGYTSCPLVTAYGRMVLAEFDYSDTPTPTQPMINTQKERFDMWLLKKYGLPFMYWNLMLRGLA